MSLRTEVSAMLDELRQRFDAPSAPTVGIEEEVMLLDPATLDLLPRADEVIAAAADPGIGAELPAAQLELRTNPHATVAAAVAELEGLRRNASKAASGIGRLAAAGAHPFAAVEGVLNTQGRYGGLLREYGPALRRQLVFGLHVHVAIRPARRAFAVHNAIRSYLPELAALAADCPFHQGRDTGYASIRPKLSEALPRQGVPPVLSGLEQLVREYEWSMRAAGADLRGCWWWEARLNPAAGTVEVRVPDAQTTPERVAAVAAAVHALAVWLAARFDAGALPEPDPSWRIEQNRWRACRYGLDAELADLATGDPRPARVRWGALLDDLMPIGDSLGCHRQLEAARGMLRGPSAAEEQRLIAARYGMHGLVNWLADRFLD